jgi:hypothetical protein
MIFPSLPLALLSDRCSQSSSQDTMHHEHEPFKCPQGLEEAKRAKRAGMVVEARRVVYDYR